MLSINIDTPQEKQLKLANRLRDLRLYRNLSRESLAQMSGVPESSIKRFELNGEISLRSLLQLALTLDAMDEFDLLFPLPKARSLDEIERQDRIVFRKRGRK